MLKQNFRLKLLQKLSPQQIQLMKLIQLPTQVFEQRIKQEIEENPALDIEKEQKNEFDEDSNNETIETEDVNIDEYLDDDEIPRYKLQSNNYNVENEEHQTPYAERISFHQFLKSQLNTFDIDEESLKIAEFLVGSIDESGYIRRDLLDIVDDLAFTQNIYTSEENVLNILKNVVQKMDPVGVGARDLKECLILQLQSKKNKKNVALSIEILKKEFNLFVKKGYKKLSSKFDISKEILKEAIKEIESLNPKPGGSFSGSDKIIEQIIPDFTIEIVEGKLNLSLNARNAPELHVSQKYRNMLKGYQESKQKSKSQKDAVLFIKHKLDSAKWFIDAIKQRQQTLLITMNAIMEYQHDYFLYGDEYKLKPMILKDIADKINMDISTVSRVANSKYVSTPYGTKLIKEFFSESMKNDQGEDISTKEIKIILKSIIYKEDKKSPLTDDKIVLKLKERGYPIARRTIAKYREQLNIPVARLRKKL